MKTLIELFFTFVKIGAFNFGGGYAILPFIEKEIVINNGWLNQHDFIDLVALSQMTPGPISINSATFIGYRLAGLISAAVGTLGLIFPAFFLVITVAATVKKYRTSYWMDCAFLGLRPAVIGLITAATISVGRTSLVDIKSVLIAAFAAVLVFKTKLHPILIILASGTVGGIIYGL
ncbi:MAG: chromate transporter [Bacillota bacterium]|nr:chromate transporter [Bacillota bacterium]MDD3298754.1 chromate transporter [Bacillota bacterium]MDD4707848.1 chromate transporter [Bacillota bacterium]